MKRATVELVRLSSFFHISIHTLCEEGDSLIGFATRVKTWISIHTLCEEGDWSPLSGVAVTPNFNPHPLWRGRHMLVNAVRRRSWFQSTPSVKRATNRNRNTTQQILISIHTLCEEGDSIVLTVKEDINISIHTLCEEGDLMRDNARQFFLIFQSTPSVKRATQTWANFGVVPLISIHTLCEEGDSINNSSVLVDLDFNPHPLWRGRRANDSQVKHGHFYFNPHPLWRGRRLFAYCDNIIKLISIHTLCEEGDHHSY